MPLMLELTHRLTLKSTLEDLAKKDNRSLTSYIVNILKKHIDNISNE